MQPVKIHEFNKAIHNTFIALLKSMYDTILEHKGQSRKSGKIFTIHLTACMCVKVHVKLNEAFFDSQIIRRMIWESMLSISPGIAPMTFYFDHTALRASFF